MEGSTLTIIPANEARCDDLRAVFGSRGAAAECQCQRYKLKPREAFSKFPAEERAARLRAQTRCGDPASETTTGLVAYLDGEPVGWCAVEPRSAYEGLRRVYKVPWEGRDEDKADPTVWAVTCVFTRAGHRHRGVGYALVRAAVDHARERGARALEGYPMLPEPGQEITWGELHMGTRRMFDAAGFREVSHPTLRRVVMRIDFQGAAGAGPRSARVAGGPTLEPPLPSAPTSTSPPGGRNDGGTTSERRDERLPPSVRPPRGPRTRRSGAASGSVRE